MPGLLFSLKTGNFLSFAHDFTGIYRIFAVLRTAVRHKAGAHRYVVGW